MLKAFGLIPVPVFYTDSNLGGYDARDYWLFIRMKKAFKHDEGLHQHELKHIEQTWKGLVVIHFALYHLWKRYRMRCEVKAYRRQMHYPPYLTLDQAAMLLSTKYDLGISFAEAKKALSAG